MKNKKAIQALFLSALAMALSPSGFANNGMYMIGYGLESSLMGGADVAVSRDAFAANNNPAGLTQIDGQMAEFQNAIWESRYRHTDSFGNYRKGLANSIGSYVNGAYARRFDNSPYAAGVAFVVQGGQGAAYRGLNNQFGGRDDATALFTIIKVAPAFAWKASEQLSLGATLGINYLSATQELFPNTSAPPSAGLPQGFSGIRFKGASGINFNYKLGLQYRPAPTVSIGVTYGTQTSVPLKDGTLRINFSDPSFGGLGVVRYDNAKLTGMRLPEELALGIAFRPTDRMLISVQDKWYNWSQALNKLTLTATDPRNPGAPPTLIIPSALDFYDQHVVAIGMAYDYDADNILLAGVNHGSRPTTDANLLPEFAPIQARHYTFGIRHRIDKGWYSGLGFEYFPVQSATYDSPIFGSNANERHSAVVMHLVVGRNW